MTQTFNKLLLPLICLLLAIATIVAFEQVRLNDFVSYDDPFYVTENPNVNNPERQSILWALTTTEAANWHPVTWLSHMLDCRLFGLEPAWHHITSLALHIANTLLLFLVLKNMTSNIWSSVFVAAAFALHPLHVESVAWIAERKDVLSGFFWMLTLAAYLRYAQKPVLSRYLPVFFALAFGLMAKPMLVTLPFVLLLLDYWPLSRIIRTRKNSDPTQRDLQAENAKYPKCSTLRLIAEKVPLLALALISSIITYTVQQSAGAMNLLENFSVKLRIENAAVAYVRYIGKIFYPRSLAVLYPHPLDSLPAWQPITALAILVVISGFVIFLARRGRFLLVGWLWYLGTLLPVIGLVQVGNQAIADRYTYLPSIGIFIIVAWAAAELMKKYRFSKIVLAISFAAILVILVVCTRTQVKYWKNSLTLYEHALAVTKNNYIIHNNYAKALVENGRDAEAVAHFTSALEINPRYFRAHNGLGNIYLKQGKIDAAFDHFNEALEISPDYYKALNNMGIVLKQQGKTELAVEKWQQALKVKPDYANAHHSLALFMAETGKHDEAVEHFKAALSSRPDWPEAHYNLASLYYRQGKPDLCVKECAEALSIKPDYLIARTTMAYTLAETGQVGRAIEHYYAALEFEPNHLFTLRNLAWILATTDDAKLRNPDVAVELAQKACEITDYSSVKELDILAAAYAWAGKFDQAVKISQKALDIALSEKNNDLAVQIQQKLQLYKAGKTVH
jgi:tetratricopeptide (TPR) repeat protein